jgi:hypothetical protein
MQRQNRVLNQLILHSFLLKADAVAKAVVAKVVVERFFVRIQVWARYRITKNGRLIDSPGNDLEPDGYLTFHAIDRQVADGDAPGSPQYLAPPCTDEFVPPRP